jgi:beta-galactosidase
VSVRSKLRNDARARPRLVLTTQLVDAAGAVAAQVVSPLSLAAGKSAEASRTWL